MSRERVLDALKLRNAEDKKTVRAMRKIETQKRLSSDEFLSLYDTLRKDGPTVKYQKPDSWKEDSL
jgi:hypothetical protein